MKDMKKKYISSRPRRCAAGVDGRGDAMAFRGYCHLVALALLASIQRQVRSWDQIYMNESLECWDNVEFAVLHRHKVGYY